MEHIELTHDVLVGMTERASSLWERLGDDYLPVAGDADGRLIEARRERWRQVVADTDGTMLDRRLAWDGLEDAAVRRALGPVCLKSPDAVPPWARTFQRLIETAYGNGCRSPTESGFVMESYLLRGGPRPFQDLLQPLAATARQWLAARVEIDPHLVSDQVLDNFQYALLARLIHLCAEPLYVRFAGYRANRTTSFGRLLASIADADATDLYCDFVAEMRRGGMVDFFAEYSSLARLVTAAVVQWVDATAEFLDRLMTDRAALSDHFLQGQALGTLTDLRTNLSDLHAGGRTTHRLTFSSDLQLIYKPRSLGIEASWFALLQWLNEHGAPLPFRVLRALDRGDYGWVEFVERRPCTDDAEARRYFTRTGSLLCLVYVLGGNDCHFENIIASGEDPVLVDLETIMHPMPRVAGASENALRRDIMRERTESVMRTGMLPRWVEQPGGRPLDHSSLAAESHNQSAQPQPKWQNINTDSMRFERVYMEVSSDFNAPTLNDGPLAANDYVEEIITGFRQMYRSLIEHWGQLLAAAGPLAAFRRQDVRFIHRATSVYYAVAERANWPDCLRDGVDHSIELDALARAPLKERERPMLWPLGVAERQALESGDIPHFVAAADSDSLIVGVDSRIAACFEGSCVANLRSRLQRLDDHDLRRQVGYIQASMQARIARHDQPTAAGVDAELPLVASLPTPDELVAEASTIAAAIRRDALGDPASGVTWMTARYVFAMDRFQLEISGSGLYDGGCGVGLFLAALEHITGGAGFRDLAFAAVAPVREELRDMSGGRLASEMHIGGGSGLGSLVYSLTRIGQFLDEAPLLTDAGRAAALITPGRIAEDHIHDVIGGSAGAVLGLLSLYEATSDATVLERAVACGDHLLCQRVSDQQGRRAWATVANDVMPTGFAHGAAGIAYALLRLYEQTADAKYLVAAAEAIDYEDHLFSVEAGNWPDLRVRTPPTTEPSFALSWCNGGPGVGLARLGGLGSLDTPAIRADVEAALALTLGTSLSGLDHICCGNMGRADILLEMGRRLSRPDVTRAGQERVAALRQRASSGGYRLLLRTEGGVSLPGMFQGMSGVGYTLLRAAYPERLPSVLLWH